LLQLGWLTLAGIARSDRLVEPGGFQTERDRQVQTLRRMAELVQTAEPHLEAERLLHEGADEEIFQHWIGAALPPAAD
jgi:hypothetical protein